MDTEDEIAKLKENILRQNFQKMVALSEIDLENATRSNYDALKSLYEGVREKYQKALKATPDDPSYYDRNVYKAQEMQEYRNGFIDRIDPQFVQDMVNNREWYEENMNKFLLNINYPCKLQTDFLKELELSQQRKNDQRYREILEQMEANESMPKERHGVQTVVDFNKKAQIAQEEACCDICKSGDYEDDDQIVFCCVCSIPVH